jgi:hypothetical protein
MERKYSFIIKELGRHGSLPLHEIVGQTSCLSYKNVNQDG